MEELKLKVRSLENENILLNALLESIEEILDGKEVSDFILSFPVVKRVHDLATLL